LIEGDAVGGLAMSEFDAAAVVDEAETEFRPFVFPVVKNGNGVGHAAADVYQDGVKALRALEPEDGPDTTERVVAGVAQQHDVVVDHDVGEADVERALLRPSRLALLFVADLPDQVEDQQGHRTRAENGVPGDRGPGDR
jgi:hypothetical protein